MRSLRTGLIALLLSVFIVHASISKTVAQPETTLFTGGVSTDVPIDLPPGWSLASWNGPAPATSVADRCFTGDLNGDGMTDFWCATDTGSSTWLIGISTGSGWSTSTGNGPIPGLPQPVGGTNLLSSCITGDLNGDGKSDTYCQYLVSLLPIVLNSSAGLSTGSGWSTTSWGPLPRAILFAFQCLTGDLNGDGKTDVWCAISSPDKGPAGRWSVGLSTGSGWSTMTWNGPAPFWGTNNLRVSDQCLTGDLNGDGKTHMWCQIPSRSGTW